MINTLVYQFYTRVRRDEVLGQIFNQNVADWDHH